MRFLVLALAAVVAAPSSPIIGPQRRSAEGAADAKPILWRDPSPLAARDPFWGFGAATRAPQGPFTFVEEDTDGTQPKVTVTDRRGESWDVKLGAEVHSEIAANRLLWRLGYLGEEMYFVRKGVIEGAKRLERAGEHIGRDGAFVSARFRREDPRRARTDEEWSFHKNPFLGTKELSGLIIAMNLMNNWDIRESRNNRVLEVKSPGPGVERWFIVSDLGATFGRMGGPLGRRSKWNLKDYIEEDFIESVQDGYVKLDYEGFGKGDLGRIPLEHARWFLTLVSGVRVEQLRRAFEAAGATPEEVDGYSTRLLAKISELQSAVRSVATR